MCKIGGQSPWGKIDYLTELLPGMDCVSTPSHGGIKLSRERNAMVPAYLRRAGGWYEEDCEWAIPVVVFECELQLTSNAGTKEIIAKGEHKKTMRDWHPEGYERYYGVTLTGADSFKRAEQEFAAANKQNWVAYSCNTTGAPEGMIYAYCTLGMRDNLLTGPKKTFLVPREDYEARGRFGFIANPNVDREVTEAAV